VATNPRTVEIAGRTFILPPEPQADHKNHTYRNPENGAPLAAVTTVMAAAGMGFQWSDERAAKRGKRVHLATEFDDAGELDENSVRESDWPYLRAYREARERFHITPVLRERPVMHSLYGYAGRYDLLGSIQQGRIILPAIADIKTGAAPWYWWVQQTAYLMTFNDDRKFLRVCIELHADGTSRVMMRSSSTWMDDVQVWMAALTIYRAKENK